MLENRAETFTGQGSQRVGMWVDLMRSPAARKIFRITDEIVGFSLSKLCAEGPLEELTETSNAQPAIVAHSLAARAALYELYPQLQEIPPVYCLGHSAGEIAALVATRVTDAETAIYLAWQRGLLMETFGGKGGMVALMGFQEEAEVVEICERAKVTAANFNGPGQTVISGGIDEINLAMEIARKNGMRTVLLEASHPFHSSLMSPVQDKFREKIAEMESKGLVRFGEPQVPLVSNVTAQPFKSKEEVKAGLVAQIVKPVRWADSIKFVQEKGVVAFLEFGPGSVLTGLLRRIDPKARGFCIKDYESAVKYLHARAS